MVTSSINNLLSGLGILRAGYIIHSAIHKARPDLNCIGHTHSLAGSAVSSMRFGLLPIHQSSQVVGEVAYHDYEGIAVEQVCLSYPLPLSLFCSLAFH
jgi:ribulose-5-phosphate 4-epimerase/fuculose-1-phosphate aldolase